MAKTAALRPLPADKLRHSLDTLADRVVQKALNDPEATVRTLSDALKIAGGYYQMSRGGDTGEVVPDAWAGYGKSFIKEARSGAQN